MGIFDRLKKAVSGPEAESKITENPSVYVSGSGVEIGGVELPKGWENYSGSELRFHASQALLALSSTGNNDGKAQELGFRDEKHLRHVHTIANDAAYFPELLDQEGVYDQGASIKEYQNEVRKQAENLTGENQILEPIDGITCEVWAQANAKIASNGDWTDEVLTLISGDRALWDKVNNAWQERMANDTSFVIAQIYGDAFNASATGNLGAKDEISEINFSYEKYIELSVAMELLTDQGKDPQQILAMFDMTVTDYSNVSNFWSHKQLDDMEKYRLWRLELEDQYREKYEVADGNDDIEF